ncbi:MAG TPA: twin-arginine translocase TatA/TatE family subunit [Polyangiaceae bacterium]
MDGRFLEPPAGRSDPNEPMEDRAPYGASLPVVELFSGDRSAEKYAVAGSVRGFVPAGMLCYCTVPALEARFMGGLSPIHWLIVIVVVLLVFGPSRLAGVGKGLGEGIRSFKKGLNEDGEEAKEDEAKSETKRIAEKADAKTDDKPDEAKPA